MGRLSAGDGGDLSGKHAEADRSGDGQPDRGKHRDERHQQPQPQRLHRQGMPSPASFLLFDDVCIADAFLGAFRLNPLRALYAPHE